MGVCPDGKHWDSLIKRCMPGNMKSRSKPKPTTALRLTGDQTRVYPASRPMTAGIGSRPPTTRNGINKPTLPPVVQVKSTTPAPKTSSEALLSPFMWISVALVTLGLILIVSLWLIICIKRTRNRRMLDDSEQQDPLQKANPPVEIHFEPPGRNIPTETSHRAPEDPSICTQLDTGDQTGSEESFTVCRCLPRHAGMESEFGLAAGNNMREHRVPLPATELGGTVLVTTKTV
ncbi:uncharacterized protein LOC121503562 [Cheilinus undulatus]|uniref:uncharacterized protein LOC121503562 n=1 Tax=Cheilinus undulatus TaxID=241271 RepID=UPI001BD5C934|nr:uncharacterized protein LOC121503562 [Cheilinus undulatus]